MGGGQDNTLGVMRKSSGWRSIGPPGRAKPGRDFGPDLHDTTKPFALVTRQAAHAGSAMLHCA